MGLPFARHLEWLCLEGLDEEKIQDFYANIQLPIPTEDDIESAKQKTLKLSLPPAVKRNLQRGLFKAEDTAYWQRLGYGELHRWRVLTGNKAPGLTGPSQTNEQKLWTEIGRMLNHPLMRTAVDVCTIARVEAEKLSLILPQVFQLTISEDAIAVYQKFFFNVGAFTRKEWMDYLERVREDKYVYTRIFAALTRPREEVMHLCGLPSDKQYSDFLRNVLAVANYKMNSYARQNTPQSDNEARRWAKIGFEAGEKFEKYGASDVSDFAKLVQTEFEYVNPDIPTIDSDIASSLRPALTDSNTDTATKKSS